MTLPEPLECDGQSNAERPFKITPTFAKKAATIRTKTARNIYRNVNSGFVHLLTEQPSIFRKRTRQACSENGINHQIKIGG